MSKLKDFIITQEKKLEDELVNLTLKFSRKEIDNKVYNDSVNNVQKQITLIKNVKIICETRGRY